MLPSSVGDRPKSTLAPRGSAAHEVEVKKALRETGRAACPLEALPTACGPPTSDATVLRVTTAVVALALVLLLLLTA